MGRGNRRDSSDDESMMPPRALPVPDYLEDEVPEDFSAGLPETAEEYLAMVRQEARKIPKVSLGEGAPPPRAPAAPRPDDAAPADGLWDVLDPDWARAQVRDFGELRAALAEAAAAGGPGPSPGAALDVGGRRRAREVAAEIVRGRGPAAGGAPPLSLVRGLDRVGAAYLIQELAGAVRGAPWARGPAEWLYGLLSHVEEPLDPETCAAVYSLSEHCEGVVRSRPWGEAPEAAVLLAVAGGFFGQSERLLEMIRDDGDGGDGGDGVG